MSGQSRQFVIRAASSDRASLKYFAGKFPLDTPDLAVAPSSGAWMVQKATVESGPADPKRCEAMSAQKWQCIQSLCLYNVAPCYDDLILCSVMHTQAPCPGSVIHTVAPPK